MSVPEGQFSFDATLPTARDRMRFTLGDTDPTNPIRFDETYDAALEYYEDEAIATAKLARAFASQFGRQPTSASVPGGPSYTYGDRVKTWIDTAKQIESAVVPTGRASGYVSAQANRAGMMPDPSSEYRREDWF
jgi:hypothetical protein